MLKDRKVVEKEYIIESEGVTGKIKIFMEPGQYVPTYKLSHPKIEDPTRAVLDSIGRHLGMFEKDNLQKAPRQINVKLVDI